MMNRFRSYCNVIISYVWSLFLTGLIAILPLALTLSIFTVSFKLLKGWLEPIQKLSAGFLDWIPHSEILLVIAFTLALGAILNFLLIRSLVHAAEKALSNIPLIRPIYSGVKQLVEAFNPQDTMRFKHIVLVEFPRPGMWSLGFLTSELPAELSPRKDVRFFNVFVPTTPNPTTGFFLSVQEQDFKIVDLTRQEAMALIMSGGIIQPERFAKK